MRAAELTPTVATVVTPDERLRLDAAGEGCFATLHVESVREVIRAVRERPVQAVLVSPGYVARDQLRGLESLVRGFPGVRTVAVVSRHDPDAGERLLELGATGVRRLVDLSARDGWRRLREIVARPGSPAAAAILGRVIPELGTASDDCTLFFQSMIRLAPGLSTVRALVRRFGVVPSTFMSRFFRAGLPSPKRYLAETRLLYAADLLEVSGYSIADVAYRLEYSSPQSFGRHIRTLTGLRAGEFRRRARLSTMVGDYCDRLIRPYRRAFCEFRPLTTGMTAFGHHVERGR
ncbi:MAG TPA: helix-turn-helix transcriptional regulator [Gemmatimonadales bacterium]